MCPNIENHQVRIKADETRRLLVLAAVDPLASLSRVVNTYSHLLPIGIETIPTEVKDVDIARQAIPLADDKRKSDPYLSGRLILVSGANASTITRKPERTNVSPLIIAPTQ